jgi:hypothetical protein
MTITIEPKATVSKQLKELSRLTRRSPQELIEAMIRPTLQQIVADGDTDLMRMVL